MSQPLLEPHTQNGPGALENPPSPPVHDTQLHRELEPVSGGPSPRGTVLLSMGLLVLSCALAAGGVLVTHYVRGLPERGPQHLLMTYLSFAPSTLALLAAAVAAVVGAVRWALFGHDGNGVRLPAARRQQVALRNLQERLLLSETAKKVAYRVEDITLLRQTIERDIEHRDFDAAMSLVGTLADTYGRIEEAEAFRERIDGARNAVLNERTAEQEQKLEDAMASKDFARALALARQAERLFPTVESVSSWRERVEAAREQHKRELERAFLQAADRDTEQAMDILRELDLYLTPEEAQKYEEVARGVISKQRDNLGVRFRMALQDRAFGQVKEVGAQIISEFPNSRMADEARQVLQHIQDQEAANARPPGALF